MPNETWLRVKFFLGDVNDKLTLVPEVVTKINNSVYGFVLNKHQSIS